MTSSETARDVVVGIDGSEDALRALDWAAHEADIHRSPVRLVHAYQRQVAMLPAITVQLPAQTREAQRALDEACARAVSAYPGLSVSMIHEEGRAPDILLREAERARLLVLGREGHGRLAELTLGSVSLAVASKAKTPVAVIPAVWEPPATPYGRIVVGVDGSVNCKPAVDYAFRSAAARNAELKVVFAWDPHVRWPAGGELPVVQGEYDEVLAEAVDRWQESYPGVKVATVTDVAKPAVALRSHAADADLVVIGGRGHGAVTGMLLGSVARGILRYLNRPVVVVHRTGDDWA